MAENNSSNIITTSRPGANESNIVDSSRPGFISSYDKTKGKKDTTTEANINEAVSKGKTFVKNTLQNELKKKPTVKEEKESLNVVRNLVKTGTKKLSKKDFKFGNMIFIRYDAKFKENNYDKTPLIFALSVSKSYTLGLNLHWTPIPLRVTLLKVILRLNKNNIKNNKPITINYKMVKPLILNLGLGPVIRLYINSRISSRGIIIPPDLWLSAARLDIAKFSQGKSSAEKFYKQAVKSYKVAKSRAIRNNKKIS